MKRNTGNLSPILHENILKKHNEYIENKTIVKVLDCFIDLVIQEVFIKGEYLSIARFGSFYRVDTKPCKRMCFVNKNVQKMIKSNGKSILRFRQSEKMGTKPIPKKVCSHRCLYCEEICIDTKFKKKYFNGFIGE